MKFSFLVCTFKNTCDTPSVKSRKLLVEKHFSTSKGMIKNWYNRIMIQAKLVQEATS